jgi:dihydrofolate synthase/folylpolyglutamate synthase
MTSVPTDRRRLSPVEPPTDTAPYWAAEARLDSLIDLTGPADRSLPATWARAAAKLDRTRAFLSYLGNPQDAFPVVHVTGTSGKGSTCAAIAGVLTRAGYRTGLATSPYLQVATEKIQIDGRLISVPEFVDLVARVLDAATMWRGQARLDRPLSYGEVWMALTATWFAERKVDIAVIEVGAGGRFDVTNVVRPLVSVVTSVGLDHTATLGPTIEQIAWHKAGIFKPGATAVTAATDPAALAVLVDEADALGIDLIQLDPARSVIIHDTGADGTSWSLAARPGQATTPVYHSRQGGRHQAVNGAVALTVLQVLGGYGFTIHEDEKSTGLAEARMPGRGERMPTATGPAVIIDAAHNPDKVRALVSSLPELLPASNQGPPVLLTGALAGKDVQSMFAHLMPVVSAVVTTSAGVTGKNPIEAATLSGVVAAAGFRGSIRACENAERALDLAMRWAVERRTAVVVTGSLYLAGTARGHWYAADEILRRQTPWPEPRRKPADLKIG